MATLANNCKASLLLGLVMLAGNAFGQCPIDGSFSPCTCSGTASSPSISCLQVPFSTVANVFLFSPFITVPINLDLRPNATDTSEIPTNIMSNKYFSSLNIRCPSNNYALRVASDAFSTSSSSARRVTLTNCDLSSINLDFISSFSELTELELSASININVALTTLRPQNLISLTRLSLYNSRGLNNWLYNPPVLPNGLTELDIGANSLTNNGANSLLRWIALSSASTLQTLYMDSNFLTEPPSQIPSMTALSYLDISYNEITSLPSGSLQFTAPVRTVLVSGNKLTSISHAAFLGNFTNARVGVQFNQLTQFESQVFEIMLNQMLTPRATGSLSIAGNPLDCSSNPCHLSWLMRNARHTTGKLDDARCVNTTLNAAYDNKLFKDLDPNDFTGCRTVCRSYLDDGLYESARCSPVYYHCSFDVPIPMVCASPSRLVFSELNGYCDYPQSVTSCLIVPGK